MSKSLAERLGENWRIFAILAAIAAAALLYVQEDGVNLGLDLQGGTHLVLEVQTEDTLNQERRNTAEEVEVRLEEANIPFQSVFVAEDGSVKILAPEPELEEQTRNILEELLGQSWRWDWSTRQGKSVVTITLEPNYRRTLEEGAVTKALEIIRRRVDEFGVSEPVITRQGLGGERIVVQLPGLGDPERIKGILKRTAYLEWRTLSMPDGMSHDSFTAPVTPDGVRNLFGGELPEDTEILPGEPPSGGLSATGEERVVYYPVKKRAIIRGNELTTAFRTQDQFGAPAVSFQLSSEGAAKFGTFTKQHIGDRLAVILENRVKTAPTIQSQITHSGQITGNFTPDEAEDLALTLRSGALPARIEILEERSVGPSLGADSIRRGVTAALVGFLGVMVFMLAWYRLAGVNAILALVLNLILVLGIMAAFGATLTLPGIAGLILTIGMAVDANVLIFERIKEEQRLGKSARAAIDGGFSKAFSTVLDANFTTLIAAVFLFNFGTGPIRGFAVTLSVGILCSLFTAIFVSRTLFDLIYARGRVERLSI